MCEKTVSNSSPTFRQMSCMMRMVKEQEPWGFREISTTQKRNSAQFQHIVDNATDIIYTTNIQGEITYVNTSANSVLGYSNDDFIGNVI